MRLGSTYGEARLEAACRRALALGAVSYKRVAAILRAGLDRQAPLALESESASPITHDNIRGHEYYH